MHCVISLPGATSYDKMDNHKIRAVFQETCLWGLRTTKAQTRLSDAQSGQRLCYLPTGKLIISRLATGEISISS